MSNLDKKTYFGIHIYEDEFGKVQIQADHYGPGAVSYQLGMELVGRLLEFELHHPERVAIAPLNYSPRRQ